MKKTSLRPRQVPEPEILGNGLRYRKTKNPLFINYYTAIIEHNVHKSCCMTLAWLTGICLSTTFQVSTEKLK